MLETTGVWEQANKTHECFSLLRLLALRQLNLYLANHAETYIERQGRTPREIPSEYSSTQFCAAEADSSNTSGGQLASVGCQVSSGLYNSISLKILSVSGPKSF